MDSNTRPRLAADDDTLWQRETLAALEPSEKRSSNRDSLALLSTNSVVREQLWPYFTRCTGPPAALAALHPFIVPQPEWQSVCTERGKPRLPAGEGWFQYHGCAYQLKSWAQLAQEHPGLDSNADAELDEDYDETLHYGLPLAYRLLRHCLTESTMAREFEISDTRDASSMLTNMIEEVPQQHSELFVQLMRALLWALQRRGELLLYENAIDWCLTGEIGAPEEVLIQWCRNLLTLHDHRLLKPVATANRMCELLKSITELADEQFDRESDFWPLLQAVVRALCNCGVNMHAVDSHNRTAVDLVQEKHALNTSLQDVLEECMQQQHPAAHTTHRHSCRYTIPSALDALRPFIVEIAAINTEAGRSRCSNWFACFEYQGCAYAIGEMPPKYNLSDELHRVIVRGRLDATRYLPVHITGVLLDSKYKRDGGDHLMRAMIWVLQHHKALLWYSKSLMAALVAVTAHVVHDVVQNVLDLHWNGLLHLAFTDETTHGAPQPYTVLHVISNWSEEVLQGVDNEQVQKLVYSLIDCGVDPQARNAALNETAWEIATRRGQVTAFLLTVLPRPVPLS